MTRPARPDTAVTPTTARRPWPMAVRLLIVFVGFFALAIARSIAESVSEEPSPSVAALLVGPVLVAAVVVAGTLALLALGRWMDRRPERDYGVGLPPRGRQLGLGLLLGALAITAVLGLFLAAGLVEVETVEWRVTSGAVAFAAVVGLGLSYSAGAFAEEAVFRGYWFDVLRERLSVWVSAFVMSVPFAAIHFVSEGVSPGFVVGAVVGSVFFVATRLLTGSLWFAVGLHAAWNAVQYTVLGISTIDDPAHSHSLLHLRRTGSTVWTGEGHALEAGLVPIAVLALCAAVALVLLRRRARS